MHIKLRRSGLGIHLTGKADRSRSKVQVELGDFDNVTVQVVADVIVGAIREIPILEVTGVVDQIIIGAGQVDPRIVRQPDVFQHLERGGVHARLGNRIVRE